MHISIHVPSHTRCSVKPNPGLKGSSAVSKIIPFPGQDGAWRSVLLGLRCCEEKGQTGEGETVGLGDSLAVNREGRGHARVRPRRARCGALFQGELAGGA